MSDTQQTDAPEPKAEGAETPQEQEHTFTQADVDRIVKERVQRERAKFADYNDLKQKAEGARTAEERLAELEQRYSEAETRALRASIANAHNIAPEDRDLFLTGTDEETLTAQAKRLAERESERKRNGNHVPAEGNNPRPNEDPRRTMLREMGLQKG